MDDLEEGKMSTIFLNEFASFQENDGFSRLEYIFAYFFILLQLFVTKQRSWGERDHKLWALFLINKCTELFMRKASKAWSVDRI